MSIFDDIVQIDENGEIYLNQWIEWDHFSIPNKPELERKIMRELMAFLGHCLKCTSLDGCYLLDYKKPEQPLHQNCDCKKINIGFIRVNTNANAELPINKLSKYIFNGKINSKGKQNIFESWGYTINDIEHLKIDIEQQCKDNYLKGNYVLKNLDEYGQRLAIPTNLRGNNFYSGWLLCPEGKIINTTPFGGWIK